MWQKNIREKGAVTATAPSFYKYRSAFPVQEYHQKRGQGGGLSKALKKIYLFFPPTANYRPIDFTVSEMIN